MPRPALVSIVLTAVLVVGCAPAAVPSAPTPARSISTPAPSEPHATTTATPTAEVTPSPTAPPTDAVPVAWHRLSLDTAPSDREDHTWTVDPSSRLAYLFGGRAGSNVRGDLWVFDLAIDMWRRLGPAGPSPKARFGHEAVWVDGLGLVIWAGQAGPTTFFDDLWAYDPVANQWNRLQNDGARPVARYGSCAAIGPDGRLWISHGFTEDGTRFADTRAYDFPSGKWTNETPAGRAPVNRCLHGCWWTDDGRFALYAGQTTGVQALGDLWALRGAGAPDASWDQVDAGLPADRNLYAFARRADSIVVFGGRGRGSAYHRDVFAIDAVSMAIRRIRPAGPQPAGRSGATLIDDPAGGRLLLFGGRRAIGALADAWELILP